MGKAVKPLKPTKAAALQLLQQLAHEHGQSIASAAEAEEPAESGQQTQLEAADQGTTEAEQAHSVQQSAAANSPFASISSDSLTQVSPSNGFVAGNDRQAPCTFTQSRSDTAADSSQSSEAVGISAGACTQQETAAAAACVEAQQGPGFEQPLVTAMAKQHDIGQKVSARPTLATAIQRRRRQLSKSGLQPGSEPEVSLALTDAQQQQMQRQQVQQQHLQQHQLQQDVGKTAAECQKDEADSAGAPSVSSTRQSHNEHELAQCTRNAQLSNEVHPTEAAQQAICASDSQPQMLAEHTETLDASEQQGRQDLLWQSLAGCLQEKQAAQKLAGLTVTLLARM